MTPDSPVRALRTAPLRRLALAAALVCAALVPAAAAADYPTPLPDFVHAGSPHYGEPLFTPFGGDEDRPVLVLYARWDDVDYPAGIDGTAMAQRFFGTGFPSITFPSVGDYFRRLSFNDLFLFPAAETQGTMNDGVVQVTVPGTKAAFFQLSTTARNKRLLELADPFVDYESFDANGNGSLSNAELVVNVVEAAPETPMWQGCGIARGVDSVSLDGAGFGGILVAMNNTATNLITIIHENGHVALGMKDLYGFQVGSLDIAAATCSFQDTTLFAPNAWHKLHWGWITPTVVTQDGFYEVRRADTTGDAFILYDPDKGHDHYLIVENRTRTQGSYDQGSSGDGLAIWRVADNAFGVATGYDPIGLVQQSGLDAWAADAFTNAPRTMTSPWLDGTASPLAVRAIGPRGDVMRAYFDVRGPGILVDPYAIDLAGPVDVAASQSTSFSLPVMNTGEADDTFTFELADLPAGWTTSTSTQTLAPGATSSASLQVTPAPNAPLGVYTIAVRGTSTGDPAVTASATFRVRVIDVTPPSVTVSLSPDRLEPPNHELIPIAATVTATDDYDPNVALKLVSVTSSELDNGLGDGDTTGDIAGAEVGTDDRAFELRAERSGMGAGRVYTVVYRATDSSGNAAEATATVRVPHSTTG
jgi:M6 family metalloprotease-like protein